MGNPKQNQRRSIRRAWLFCVALGLLTAASAAEAASGAAGSAVTPDSCGAAWHAPVDAPVVDGYRPPANPYGPGNRGLEYGTVGGEEIVAVADGDVSFAGSVGRAQFVVVVHQRGLRSTYAYVSSIKAAAGQTVSAGQPLALAEPGFHLTARVGSHYQDPTPLLIGSCFTVKLVRIPGPDQLAEVRT